ncbi:MAG: homoserine O-acetyltransferase [Kiritimatiellae bacterium]|nr:homoserine O-acetyltransferase [Kiritimatiellia bacterium]
MAKNTQEQQGVGTVEVQYLKLQLPPEGLLLEKGGMLPEVTVAYERCGKITADNRNVVFVCHALTGDSHVVGCYPGEDRPSGWWEGMIGPNLGVDTNHYQVICANILGGCKGTTGPSSIDPRTGKPYGSTFPKITIGDIVTVHRLFLRQLGITHLAAIMGGSFGGMQVIEWMVRYSDEIDNVLIIASAASLNSQSLAFDVIGRHAIVSDPNFHGGDYYAYDSQPSDGLANARRLAHITYLSQRLLDDKFGREKRKEWLEAGPDFQRTHDQNFGTFFQIESYLKYQGDKFIQRFDANSYLHITLALDEYDVAEKYGSLEKAFEKVSSRVLIVSLSGDWLFNPEQSNELVSALIGQKKRVSYCHLDAATGHDAFLTHIHDLKRVVRAFLPSDTPGDEVVTPYRNWQLRHYREVVELVPEKSRVLDLGCGNGALLNILRDRRSCRGSGVEIDVEQIIPAIGSGCDVLLEDLDDGLGMIPDNTYDVAVLSETLQTIRRPRELMRQILRVAREAVIAFPNFGCFEVRRCLMLTGRMPKGKQIPFEWYDTPNIHLFTLKDFLYLCREERFKVLDLVAQGRGITERALIALGFKNLGASRVIVRITKDGDDAGTGK